jgi:hypothetical protein
MSFFTRGSNKGRNANNIGNWQRGHRRIRLSIHFDVDPKELSQLFQVGFFNLVVQGILQPRPDRNPFHSIHNFSGIPVHPHVSIRPEPPTNDGWKVIVHQPVFHHLSWPTTSFPLPPPPLKNQVSQVDPDVSPVQSSHASKRLKIYVLEHVQDKGKRISTPSDSSKESSKIVSSHLHLKDDCSHVISAVQPQGFNQSKATTEKSKGGSSEKRKNASHSKYGF